MLMLLLLLLLFLLFLLLLLFDIFQKTKDKERTKESKSFWKTRERQTFSRRLFLFCPSFGFLHKKKAPNRSTFDIKHKHHGQGTNDANTLSMVARVFLILSRALGKKKDARGRTGGRGNVFSARGPRGVRVKNVAEGNGKCFRIRSKKGARRMNARDARSDGRRRGVGTIRLDA